MAAAGCFRAWRRVALAALVLAGACRGGSSESKPPASPEPRLGIEPPRLDLGRLVQDEEGRGTVNIKNEGSAPLELGAVDGSRFCSGRIEATPIPPGGSASLVVTCRSDLHGPLREEIGLHTNDPRLPRTLVPILGEVRPLFAFDAPVVELRLGFGEERSEEVHLVGTLVEQARPRLTTPAAPDTEIVPLPSRPGGSRGYRVRCLGRKVGANAGNIVVATGLPRPREVAIPYACHVAGTLDVSPSNPFFNLKVPGDKALRIMVKSSQPQFEVQSVRVLDGPFAARFEHAEDDNTYRVDVTVLGDRIEDEARAATGTLLIVSNDRTEPRKEVPLFGSGRIHKEPAPSSLAR